jgi:hypothetical protein
MMFGGGRKWPVHVHMRFYQLSEVPRSEEEVAVWLRERWEEKDELLVSAQIENIRGIHENELWCAPETLQPCD